MPTPSLHILSRDRYAWSTRSASLQIPLKQTPAHSWRRCQLMQPRLIREYSLEIYYYPVRIQILVHNCASSVVSILEYAPIPLQWSWLIMYTLTSALFVLSMSLLCPMTRLRYSLSWTMTSKFDLIVNQCTVGWVWQQTFQSCVYDLIMVIHHLELWTLGPDFEFEHTKFHAFF